MQSINLSIDENDIDTVNNVDSKLITDAINRLKLGKSDSNFDFGSDSFLNAADIISEKLAFLFQTFLTHSFIPIFLLICNLIPIVKDKLGNLTSSENYRAIAISSLLLKIIDWIILISYGDKLDTSDL